MMTCREMRVLDGSVGYREKPDLPIFNEQGVEVDVNTDLWITNWMFQELKYGIYRTVKFGKTKKHDKKLMLITRKGKQRWVHRDEITNKDTRHYRSNNEILTHALLSRLDNKHKTQVLTDSLGRKCIAYVNHPGFHSRGESDQYLNDEACHA